MANEFDLDRAKRGEEIETLSGNTWEAAHFIGMAYDGTPVIQTRCLNNVWCTPFRIGQGYVRMKPKPPITMFVQLYRNGHGVIVCTNPHEDHYSAQRACENCKLIGEPQAVLVPDE